MVTHVFDNSNLSQKIFCNRHLGSFNMLFGTWSQAHAYDPSAYMETRLNDFFSNHNTIAFVHNYLKITLLCGY